MPAHPRADPPPPPLNAISGTPLKNKASSHHTQTYSGADPAIVWKVKNGFRKILHRGVGRSLRKVKLEESLFPDEILKAAFPRYEFSLDSVVNHLTSLRNPPILPSGDGKREVQWTSYFNAISDAVEKLTSTKPKRRWIAAYADKPVPNSKMSRKPDITLVPLDFRNLWKGKEFIAESEAVNWSMFCTAGEEKKNSEARTSRVDDCLDNQIMDRAYFMFNAQPNRRFILNLSIAGPHVRITQFNRAHVLHSDYFDASSKPNYRRLLRLIISLMFCANADIGYDPTIRVGIDAEGDPVYYVTADEKEYRIIKTLFLSDYICGRGTIVWRAVPADCVDLEDQSQWVTIKDVWADTSRFHTEDWFLRHARDAGITEGIPELLWGGVVPFEGKDDTTDRHSSRLDRLAPAPDEHKQSVDESTRKRKRNAPENVNVIRAHRRLVFKNCGIPITQFRNKQELLEVLIELIQVHQRLARKDFLHRDVSIRNVMMLKEENTDIYRGFLIDFDYMLLLTDSRVNNPNIAHRTGTTPFMSISVLLGTEEHREADDLESFFYVLLFLCLEYSGPGRPRDWDICKTELHRWIEGDFAAIGAAKNSDVTSAKRFKTIVLDHLPHYFQDLGACLDDLRRYIFLSQLSGHSITHEGLIRILKARSKEPFDESVEEEATPSSKKPKRRKRGVIDAGSQKTESESEWGSEDDAVHSDGREDGYTKRERMEDDDDEGGDSLQDDDGDEDGHPHWQAKGRHLQARASRSDPALTTLFPSSQLRHPQSPVLPTQSTSLTVPYQQPSSSVSRPARSSAAPVARSFNSEPIPPERFYAKLPQREK